MRPHLTEDEICGAIVGQATLDEQQHLRECDACRAEVERTARPIAAFRAGVVAAADRHPAAARPSFRRAARTVLTWEWGVAATVCVAVLTAVVWRVQPPAPVRPDAGGGFAAADSAQVVTSEFFPLAYSTVPASDGRLIRLEVPASALASFGLEAEGASRDAVLADVVVGADGLARAVRFVFPRGGDRFQKEKTP
jgi:hypothetical protein